MAVLRELKQKDAAFMLEWMHDSNVYAYLEKDFSSMTIENCQSFIKESQETPGNGRNFAIVDKSDEYMGTISLKNIEWEEKRAEYAISCRTKAMGKGFAKAASEELFQYAAKELGLNLLYLYVRPANVRAQKLYDKVGFERIEKPSFIQEKMDPSLIWFQKRLNSNL